jgi:putative ABC transport system permease protein
MLTSYVKLALKVLLRRKFFTFISLFGITFTLLVLTVATAMLDATFAPMAPETRQDRTLGIYMAEMRGPHAGRRGDAGYLLIDKYARNLPNVERLSLVSTPQIGYGFVDGRRVKLHMKRTDGEFWRILDFNFLEGSPYSDDDVANARFVAVINESTRDRFFGRGPAVGRTIDVDGQNFRVIGVVPDVPILRVIPFADVYAPTTTAKTDAYKRQLMGGFMGILLARSKSDFPAIKEEFKTRLPRIEMTEPEFKEIAALPETYFEGIARLMFSKRLEVDSHPERLWYLILGIGFLFILLPTVNLVNLNVSRIMERASEIGVRKAFGASSWTLVGQFIVENVVLVVTGGLLAFALAAPLLSAIADSGLIKYAEFRLNYRVFLYGFGIAVFFGLLSGVYPAWRMSRLNPVQALKGAVR